MRADHRASGPVVCLASATLAELKGEPLCVGAKSVNCVSGGLALQPGPNGPEELRIRPSGNLAPSGRPILLNEPGCLTARRAAGDKRTLRELRRSCRRGPPQGS